MPKLTLPIAIGKQYIRRDGEIITTVPHLDRRFACTNGRCGSTAVWCRSGLVFEFAGQTHEHDLVADATEAKGHKHAALMAQSARIFDAARLDWLDVTNSRFRMGWDVGSAPAGNVSIKTIIMGGKPIREAIDAAMNATPPAQKQAAPTWTPDQVQQVEKEAESMLGKLQASPQAPSGEASHSDTNQQTIDPLQGAANWLREAIFDCGVGDLQRNLMIGYNRAQRLFDTTQPAEKQAAPSGETAAARDVLSERRRQMEVEGWTPEHDDEHGDGQMAKAAACYVWSACYPGRTMRPPHWPWEAAWWKPRGPRRDLVRAVALLIAEIERLDRATPPSGEDKA